MIIITRGGRSHVITLWRKIVQPSIVLRVEACLAVSKVANCIEKACKSGGMLWYRLYNWFFKILKGVKVELLQPFLWDHEMTDDAWPTSSGQMQMLAWYAM